MAVILIVMYDQQLRNWNKSTWISVQKSLFNPTLSPNLIN